MLDPASLDLDELSTALEDRSLEITWWIHPADGRIESRELDDPPPDEWRTIGTTGSHEGYRDMAEFVASVHHRRAAELLDRAISGRGAFRRFKDTLFEFPELREQWFRFRDARARRRALRWLADAGLVDTAAAEQAMQKYPDPVTADDDVPAAVAVDLGILYGDRLKHVLLFGEAVQSDQQAEYTIELIVVLHDLRSPWDELRAMDDVLWRHAERSGMTVLAVPVSPQQWAARATPLLRRAAAEAVTVA